MGNSSVAQRERIADFLAQKRIAVIGASRDEKAYSRMLLRELLNHGHDALPVNPLAANIDGQACVSNVARLSPLPDGALLLLSKAHIAPVFRECCAAAIPRIWIPVGIAMGAISKTAYAAAEAAGIRVIRGFCPLMFLSDVAFYHHLHGFFAKLGPRYRAP
jgi:predicted CoA-binding protein